MSNMSDSIKNKRGQDVKNTILKPWGPVAALIMPHTNGLIAFERTKEQTTETMPLAPKQ